MAKIVVAVSGLKGMLFFGFGVLRRIEDDGRRIVLSSPTNVKDWKEVNGFHFFNRIRIPIRSND